MALDDFKQIHLVDVENLYFNKTLGFKVDIKATNPKTIKVIFIIKENTEYMHLFTANDIEQFNKIGKFTVLKVPSPDKLKHHKELIDKMIIAEANSLAPLNPNTEIIIQSNDKGYQYFLRDNIQLRTIDEKNNELFSLLKVNIDYEKLLYDNKEKFLNKSEVEITAELKRLEKVNRLKKPFDYGKLKKLISGPLKEHITIESFKSLKTFKTNMLPQLTKNKKLRTSSELSLLAIVLLHKGYDWI
jgi:hypothetical protein